MIKDGIIESESALRYNEADSMGAPIYLPDDLVEKLEEMRRLMEQRIEQTKLTPERMLNMLNLSPEWKADFSFRLSEEEA